MAGAVVISVSCLAALGACSQGSGSDANSDSAGSAAESGGVAGSGEGQSSRADAPDAASAAIDGAPADQIGKGSYSTSRSGNSQPAVLTESSLIKTGTVSLESEDIGRVLTRIYSIVASTGGGISKEDTTTDRKGQEIRSLLVLRVPVDEFDSTINEVSTLGTLVSKARSERDVTTAVIDIDSRVRSAQRSIATLRTLFSRATRLGDIIRLESELSQREADLESLQSQQRALADKTTMSTLTVTIDQPTKPQPKPQTKNNDDKAGGFVSGIKKGWDAMKTTVLAVGHGLGLVLPLGTLILLVAAIVFWGVRRWVPARPTRVAEDGPSVQ
ncbi:MAG: DUF4349 domain-containing protein [Nocardioidaceae bacterium]